MVLLDTCALIELCRPSPSFSKRTQRAIEQEAFLLSISFAEIACKVKIGRLDIGISTESLYDEMRAIETLTIINISATDWLESISLDWPENRDPADRLMVAYAARNQLPIVTTDQSIKKFYKHTLW